jgi:DNA-binding helix-hairpin-helix protein with protein kinase domain
MAMHPTLRQLDALPPALQQQVILLIQTLLRQSTRPEAQPLTQTWAGAMASYRDQYTGLSLQQETVERWGSSDDNC